jgi:hypothetical protein
MDNMLFNLHKPLQLPSPHSKYPGSTGVMQQIWQDNQNALLNYLALANTGVRGIVTNAKGLPLAMLTVRVDAREPFFKTSSLGEFYRLLLPGTYQLALTLGCGAQVLHTQQIVVSASQAPLQLSIVLNDAAYAA